MIPACDLARRKSTLIIINPMRQLLTAREAANRMGVKVETIYAYVSRGMLESHPGEGRARLFDSRAVEALARRGRPRVSSRSTSLNMLIETRLTSITADGPCYRGIPSSELAHSHPFEHVAELLWLGALDPRHVPWRGTRMQVEPGIDLAGALRVIAAHAMLPGHSHTGRGAEDVAGVGRWLIATMTDSLPVVGNARVAQLVLPNGGPAIRSSIAGRLWGKLSPRAATPPLLAALNAALVLLADHELAASTLGVRVAASAHASPAGVVSTGLGVLSGTLHGGASRPARALLDDALARGARAAVSLLVASGQRAPGFGHKVYVGIDPRANVLFSLLRAAPKTSRLMAVADAVCAEVRDHFDREANIDFAMATFTHAADMPPDAAEAIMAIARTAGWLAHAIEEYQEVPLRFRPRALYIGA
jgi:citrate synthase